jgi:light-regulated signal transduction histidine kinase (bacteriophytochrome)
MNKADLSQCDREPIHIPGSVQPFAALVICEAESMRVVQATVNCEEITGLSHGQLLGKVITEQLELGSQNGSIPSRFEGSRYAQSSYRAGPLYYFELEKKSSSDPTALAQKTRAAMEKIQSQTSWQGFLDEGARQIQALTGYDRVMIYHFHEDLHGEVMAEACNPGVESYLGLHYPASDIPAPARKVFLENWVRMIPTVNYTPVPFEPVLNPVTGATPDLGKTLPRSVSPIHLEYLRNMEVGASLSLSILSEGKLWGLVACHHLQPKYLDENERGACEILARLISSLLRDVSRVEEFNQRERLREIHRKIVSHFGGAADLGKILTQESPNLLDLVNSQGAAVALYLDGHWETAGEVPSDGELDALVDWLTENHPGQAVVETSHLSSLFAPAASYEKIASGLLAISVPKTKRNYILLFRPEIVRTVRWAGKPDEKIATADGRLHPRASFGEWSQSVRSRSAPWRSWELDAALELRSAILAADLSRQFEKEQKARQEAEVAMRLREELMAVLSHDLKNPIGSIMLQAQLMERAFEKSGETKSLENARRILRVGHNMNNLINDILHVTKLESGTLVIEKAGANIADLLHEAADFLGSLAAHGKIELKVRASDISCRARVDRERVIQVLSNLVGNAIKFTPPEGSIELSLEKCGPEFAQISVSDTGPGIPKEHHELIFDRFWQANQARRLGTGLGLAICKGIVEGHGGKIWVESREGGGSTFRFTLPLA